MLDNWLFFLIFFLVLLAFCFGVLFLVGWIVIRRWEKRRGDRKEK